MTPQAEAGDADLPSHLLDAVIAHGRRIVVLLEYLQATGAGAAFVFIQGHEFSPIPNNATSGSSASRHLRDPSGSTPL